jgi:hypothetical protein
MQKMRGKKAAIEMSIGTIVVVVLSMSMLILGLVLIKTIFTGAKNVADMTNDQLTSEISKLFGADQKVAVYPNSKQIEIVQGKASGFGIGIKNLRTGSSSGTRFSYEVVVSDPDVQTKCGVTDAEILKLITTGRSAADIPIASGETFATKVLLETQTGDPLCTVRFRVDVKANIEPYGSPQIMDVTFRAA